ncbi:MAG: 2-amino-4-hydroxy-6-hydroxymethyldihydropteridine diphosphokinase [Pseudomonadota bacterium]
MLAKAYIGLGGNIGDVVANMAGALRMLDQSADIEVLSVSKVYRTPPWGIEDQDWFHNACAGLLTSLQPFELLAKCQEIERVFKRDRQMRWGPRTLDLDILAFDGVSIHEEELTIPHPRMHERSFVMLPLNDVAQGIEILGKTPVQWLDRLDTEEIETVEVSENWWV